MSTKQWGNQGGPNVLWSFNFYPFNKVANLWTGKGNLKSLFWLSAILHPGGLTNSDCEPWGSSPKYLIHSSFYDIYNYYIHTEKYSPKSYFVNFRTQISSSQSEERAMVFTREKNDTSNQNREMIRPIRSHRGVWVSHQNSRLLLQFAAPLRTHSTRNVFFSTQRVFLAKKVKNISEME